MKILIAVATLPEIEPLLPKLNVAVHIEKTIYSGVINSNSITVLITGIGMVATTYALSKIFSSANFDYVINAGICGSFNRNLEIGNVVNVVEDTFSELGAEDGEQFLTLQEINLKATTRIINERQITNNKQLNLLPKVSGITVNTTHGNEYSISKVVQHFHPLVESMEGAAFMYVCENEKVNYSQIRAVSNYVETRNRNAWNIPLAIQNLNSIVFEILTVF